MSFNDGSSGSTGSGDGERHYNEALYNKDAKDEKPRYICQNCGLVHQGQFSRTTKQLNRLGPRIRTTIQPTNMYKEYEVLEDEMALLAELFKNIEQVKILCETRNILQLLTLVNIIIYDNLPRLHVILETKIYGHEYFIIAHRMNSFLYDLHEVMLGYIKQDKKPPKQCDIFGWAKMLQAKAADSETADLCKQPESADVIMEICGNLKEIHKILDYKNQVYVHYMLENMVNIIINDNLPKLHTILEKNNYNDIQFELAHFLNVTIDNVLESMTVSKSRITNKVLKHGNAESNSSSNSAYGNEESGQNESDSSDSAEDIKGPGHEKSDYSNNVEETEGYEYEEADSSDSTEEEGGSYDSADENGPSGHEESDSSDNAEESEESDSSDSDEENGASGYEEESDSSDSTEETEGAGYEESDSSDSADEALVAIEAIDLIFNSINDEIVLYFEEFH